MSKCRKCPAEIQFCKTSFGKWMPIDADPDPKGNLYKTGESVEGVDVVETVSLFTPADAERYMPHWATCPAADEFRQ